MPRTRTTPQGLTQWFCTRCVQWVGIPVIPMPRDAGYACMWCIRAPRTRK
jgi:hypothetical protein